MEDCNRSKFENYNGVNNMVSNQAVVKSQLSIQRCYSDGVLTNGHVATESKVLSAAGKSSSESSMNGSPVTTPTKLDTKRKATINIDCEISSSHSSDECSSDNQLVSSVDNERFLTSNVPISNGNVVRPKVWKRRIEEKYEDGKTKGRNGDIDLQMNGLGITNGINVHQRGHSHNVCELYKNETDLFVSRLRGGVRRDMVVNGHGLSYQHENGSKTTRLERSRQKNTQRNEDSSLDEVCNDSYGTCNEISSDIQCLIAPLAIPENLSDEESPSRETLSAEKEAMDGIYRGTYSDSTCSDNDPSTLSGGCSNGLMPSCLQNVSKLLPLHRSSNSSHKEYNTNGAECLECLDSIIQHSNAETQHITHGVRNAAELCSLVQDNMLPAQASRVSSFDSLDDIGDFIEADLPPNVERLAFFSRGSSQSSSTEEDEGCGDEVFPSNLDDVDSENETIDPLISNACARYPLQNDHNRLKIDNGMLNTGNNVTSRLPRSEGGDLPVCNILSCVDDELQHTCNSCACGGLGMLPHASRFNTDTVHHWNSFISEDKNDGKMSNKGDNTCVCCDKLIDVNIQRRDEIGVNVCDKCFNEHNFERNGTFENAVKNRSKPIGAFSFNSQFPKRNCNSLQVAKNMQEKVNNNSLSSFRLSSSDSDPIDKLYVSDSSEVVSPEGDTGPELVFNPSGANIAEGATCNITDGAGVIDGVNIIDASEASVSNVTDGSKLQSEEKTDATALGEDRSSMVPNFPVCRQSISLDFNTTDEVLYCPYFNRRSRSLDQDSTDHAPHSRSPECDVPNIAVATSNFQEDESNNQEKLFEKQAYEVDHMACSSSDEEENTRVPVVAAGIADFIPESQAGLHMQESISFTFPRSSLERYKRRNKSLGLEEEEPIYEDIDDLELLLEEVCSDGEPDNRVAPQPLSSAISKLRRKRRHRSPISDVEKVMIWNEYEAYVVQVKQIGTSACGPTAVLNVLKAFDFQVEKEEVVTTITSNLRMEAAPIPYYLFSRYSAGTTAQTLVEGVATVTRGAIKGRFFHFYPPRELELLKWLGHWMKKGAVPVATLNLQKGVKRGWTIPDAWHHQMVYGVSSKGVYLTNPLEIVPENIILEQLMSDSVLLVRRQDVVSRFRDWCPLNEILKQRDPRWRTMNVLGQIVHMLREHCMPQEQLAGLRSQLTSHICIPAAYKAGIILFMKAKSESYEELLKAPELPLKNTQQSSGLQ